jgi:hypothetical protein
MITAIGITKAITNLNEAQTKLNLSQASDPNFFPEWQAIFPVLSQPEQQALDRLKQRYFYYAADGTITEGTINLILLSPLLEILGLCDPPYKVRGERHVRVEIEDNATVLEGFIDALVVRDRFWLVLIEGKRYGFSVMQALPQTLAYLAASPSTNTPTFAVITTGEDYLFVKFDPRSRQYDFSDKLTLTKRYVNELHQVAQIIKSLIAQNS